MLDPGPRPLCRHAAAYDQTLVLASENANAMLSRAQLDGRWVHGSRDARRIAAEHRRRGRLLLSSITRVLIITLSPRTRLRWPCSMKAGRG